MTSLVSCRLRAALIVALLGALALVGNASAGGGLSDALSPVTTLTGDAVDGTTAVTETVLPGPASAETDGDPGDTLAPRTPVETIVEPAANVAAPPTSASEQSPRDTRSGPASSVAETVGQAVEPVTTAAASLVQAAAQTTAPLVETVAEPLAPVVETVGQAVEPVTTAAAPLVQAAAQTTAPLVETVAEPLAPVVETVGQAVEPVTTAAAPLVQAAAQTTAPLVETVAEPLAPVVETVGAAPPAVEAPEAGVTAATRAPIRATPPSPPASETQRRVGDGPDTLIVPILESEDTGTTPVVTPPVAPPEPEVARDGDAQAPLSQLSPRVPGSIVITPSAPPHAADLVLPPGPAADVLAPLKSAPQASPSVVSSPSTEAAPGPLALPAPHEPGVPLGGSSSFAGASVLLLFSGFAVLSALAYLAFLGLGRRLKPSLSLPWPDFFVSPLERPG